MTTGTRTLTVRALAWTDIPRLARLETELFAQDAWSEQTWWAELAGRPRRDYVVVTPGPGADQDDVLGYAGLDLGGEVADIMTIAVAPAAQGTGLGSELLDLLSQRAREAGAAYLMLEVRDDNEPAKKLYARAGFETLTVRRRYYQPGDIDALVMRKSLEPTEGETDG
ncbi:MAG: ribosomal protein S18-alanine N-acetyltransferase [Intrasporangiaceae bacterium]|nr:ribosomal protein S18-alanine N-acetyltransferase [Intrasporangiaceae bacterium]